MTQVNPLSEALDCLKALEWSAAADVEQGGTVSACPWCDRTEMHGIHDAHCKLAALIDAPRDKIKIEELPTAEWQVVLGPSPVTLLVSMHERDGFRTWTTVRLAEPLEEQIKAQHGEASA